MTFWLLVKAIPIKYIIILALACGLVYIFQDWRHQIKENKRLEENSEQLRKADSIGFSSALLTKDEMIEELSYNRQDLIKELDKRDINYKRIERLITVRNEYQDTTNQSYALSTIIKAIEDKQPIKERFIDSTACHIIEGYIHYDGQDLKVNISNRQFSNITDIVAHAEKVGMRFWKWFRKKKVTVTVLNSCGETQTKLIDVQK